MGPHAGYVAIIGKPNAGKSTLLNAVLGQKLSIVTPKAQTTRHRIIGVHSGERFQCILLDTPGILRPVSQPVSLPISVCAPACTAQWAIHALNVPSTPLAMFCAGQGNRAEQSRCLIGRLLHAGAMRRRSATNWTSR